MNRFKVRKLTAVILLAAMIMTVIAGCGEPKKAAEGVKAFKFVVVDAAGSETNFDLKTEKEMVGEALFDEGLIEGEEGAYGLYVKKVNGIEAIYENDGTYWAFYINDEYAMTGVDATPVEDGATYMFKVEG